MMGSYQIPCCYHPTTILAVDDNKQYHLVVKFAIDPDKGVCAFYDDPRKAFQFLKHEYTYAPFTRRCIAGPEDQPFDSRNLEINIRAIRDEIYYADRFNEVSTLVLDFAMPGLNGGDLAKQLKGLPFKILLLTGEADSNIAIELFNQGLIHAYLRKDDVHFDAQFKKIIADLQNDYFLTHSSVVFNSLSETASETRAWFSDPNVKLLLDDICKKHHIIEYYLLDEFGSYLLLDIHGHPSWLVLADENQMQAHYDFAECGDDVPDDVLTALKNKSKVPYFHTDTDWTVPPAQWAPYLHPTQTLNGHETYYYAHITDPNAYPIEPGRILSYQQFLTTHEGA